MMELNMESSKRVRVAFGATETKAGREDQGKEAETLLKETRTDTSHGQWIKRTRLNQKRDSTVDTMESRVTEQLPQFTQYFDTTVT